MASPLGYLLTWSCYGQRLHGDPRGTVNDQQNTFGTPMVGPSRALESYERSRLVGEPMTLVSRARTLVHATICEHAHVRGWCVHALNVRTTHVHVVVGVLDRAPMRAQGEFKAWSTRRLREAGVVGSRASVWTKQGSAKWIWEDEGWDDAVRYVLSGQGEDLDAGLPRSTREWLSTRARV